MPSNAAILPLYISSSRAKAIGKQTPHQIIENPHKA